MKSVEKICIQCPAGCHLTITGENGNYEVTGNNCPRGKVYALNEMTDPRRTVTASVPVHSEITPCLPVKTDAPLPMRMISELLQKIYQMRLELPAQAGMVLIQNYENTGINVVLTRGAEK